MSLSISNENKNSLSLTNEGKVSKDETWDEATFSWDDADASTWNLQRMVLSRESKNNLSLSNEAKN